LSLTSLLSAPEREVTSPSDFKVVGALISIKIIACLISVVSFCEIWISKENSYNKLFVTEFWRFPSIITFGSLTDQIFRESYYFFIKKRPNFTKAYNRY
jgi:hypothetical protein